MFCKADLVVMNSLCFWFSGKVFLSCLHFWRAAFHCKVLLVARIFFFFYHIEYIIPLSWSVSFLLWYPLIELGRFLCMILITFFLIVIKILSLALIIDGLTTMCLSEFSPGLYLYGDAWPLCIHTARRRCLRNTAKIVCSYNNHKHIKFLLIFKSRQILVFIMSWSMHSYL